ncbi:MAG: HEPN domain-containing protein [Verrucomicrobia bacterium]|nr:HEPN domain-containing protein [Verrucomicrobiota bacterium]
MSAAESEAERWLRYAREDLRTAQALLRDPESLIPRHACWLAQQATEKAIKTLFVRAQIDFPRTHDLDLLWSKLPAATRAAIQSDALAELSEWAVESRYPGDWPDADAADARAAVAAAANVCAQVEHLARP